jgi:HK97 family phage major capsid protein
MADEIKQLNEKLDKVLEASTAAQDIANRALKASEVDPLDKDQIKKASEDATQALADAQEIKGKLDAVEKTAEHIEKAISRMGAGTGDSESKELEAKAADETARYMRVGQPMSDEVKSAVVRALCDQGFYGVPEERKESEIKTLIAGVNPQGGYFIRPERSTTMIQRIFESSPMRRLANVETTNSDSLEMVIDDDEATSGGWVGETSPRGETGTPEIGLLSIPAHEQFAQPKATQKMLDDAGFDIEAWLSRKVTNKMIRVENTSFVVGDGSQKPRGFLALSAWQQADTYERFALEQINSGDASNLTADGLKKLQNSLIEDYQAGAVFAMKRASFEDIITLKDGQGQYLLNPRSLKEGDTKILLGKEVVFMDDMPAVAADALAVAYGNFQFGYTIVDRIGFRVLRDDLTEKPFIKFYTTKRTGGDVTNYESIKIQKVAV